MANKDKLKSLLFIDIETIPQKKNYNELDEVTQRLFHKKISNQFNHIELDVEMMYKNKGGIFAEFGQIICISVGFIFERDNHEICFQIKNFADKNEPTVLQSFLLFVENFLIKNPFMLFAGHNIKEFDLPFIGRRLIVNNIKIPHYLQFQHKKPWEIKMVDSLQYWKFGDYKNYVSLELLAHILGIPSPKITMDGSDVQHVYYIENDLPKIIHYCNNDVYTNFLVILKLLSIQYDINKINLTILP